MKNRVWVKGIEGDRTNYHYSAYDYSFRITKFENEDPYYIVIDNVLLDDRCLSFDEAVTKVVEYLKSEISDIENMLCDLEEE